MAEEGAEEFDQDDERAKEIREDQTLELMNLEQEVEQLGLLLKDEAVRDVMWRILSKCQVFASTYSKNFGDMAFAEGRRDVGLWLLTQIAEADPEALLAMQTKANRLHAQRLRQERTRRARRARRG